MPDTAAYRHTPVSSTTLETGPESPATARKWVGETLAEWCWPGATDEVTLLVDELVTNAMLHAHGPIRVTMSIQDGCLWVDVRDHGVGHVVKRRFDTDATMGRGLQVLDRLSRSWGVLTEPDGKHVWFELEPTPI